MPVRVRLREDEPVAGLLKRLQEEQAALVDHHHLGLSEVQRQAGSRDLFDTTMVFESYPLDASTWESPAEGLKLVGVAGTDATHYPLALSVIPGARLTLRLGYRTDAFAPAEAELYLARLDRLLQNMAAQPDLPTATVDFLSPEERYRLLAEFGGYGAMPA
ncbi:condensation domain-containing protein [Streptomyces sp. NPDC048045]|uniref:condensation domain-containing protein n=1 Tax=Streptomyces sp. NPDC048045 TaxID=3154710 RepID=UPI00341DB9DC